MRALLLCLVACVPPPDHDADYAAVEHDREARIVEIKKRVLRKIVAPSCDESAISFPGTHVGSVGGVSGEQECGLIAVDVFRPSRVRPVCSDLAEPDCARTMFDMFFEKMKRRYGLTDWSEVLSRSARTFAMY